MAITILKQPAQLILSRQPAVFSFRSSESSTPLRLGGGITGETADSVPADSNKEARFDFADYLQGRITTRGKQSDVPVTYSDIPEVVTFTMSEIYGTPPTVHYGSESSDFYLLDGKVPVSMRQIVYVPYNTLLEYLVGSKVCLTWLPHAEYKRVLPDQDEFLNYMQVQSSYPEDLHLHVTLGLSDGTTVSMGQVYSTVSAVPELGIVYFPTGYLQLGIDAWMASNYPSLTCLKYVVAIYNGSTNYSQAYCYTVDRNYYDNPRQLWVKNAFGLWEVILCTGLGVKETEINPEIAETDGETVPDKLVWSTTRGDTVKVNTGFYPSTQMQWLTDLLDTDEACELIDGDLWPIVLRKTVVQSEHDGDYQFSVDLEYEYAYTVTVEEEIIAS